MSLSPFHFAIPVFDLPAARRFYGEVFGFAEGRSSKQWVDFDFYGHQLVIHEQPKMPSQEKLNSNPVDGHDVPVPHFGIVLKWDEWEALAERLKSFGTQCDRSVYPASRAKSASRPPCFCSIRAAMRSNSRRSRI